MIVPTTEPAATEEADTANDDRRDGGEQQRVAMTAEPAV